MRRVLALFGCAILGAPAADLETLFRGGHDHPAIEYHAERLNDAIAGLNQSVREGSATLRFEFENASGYLRSVLRALDVPVESQMAVFSKTSLQAKIIGPRNPRIIFFNDRVVVAWVRGEPFVEVAAQDPERGVIFYTLDQLPAPRPQFKRDNTCLTCHESLNTVGVPGMLLRSVYTGADGGTLRHLGDYQVDHRSPVEHRWGGWYVTGKFGAVHHIGNAVVRDLARPDTMVTNATLNLESLEGKVDPAAYLSPYSDVAALLVFEHQMRMMNLLTRLGWEIRLSVQEGPPSATTKLARDVARDVVDYMLFIDEAPLTGWVRSTSGFDARFAAQGPRDAKGRGLRDLELEHRLMRYRCSYMIYSPAFDALPEAAKVAVYQRMWEILGGAVKSPLGLEERRAIVEILRATKSGLPAYFK